MVPSSWGRKQQQPGSHESDCIGGFSICFASERNPHSNKLTNNILHWWSHLGLNQGPAIYETAALTN